MPTNEPTEERTTKQRIMDAALETLRTSGIVGTSARAIASTGGFNQALIFYHFGSVNRLLIEAAAWSSARQVSKYKEAATKSTSLSDLVEIARRLHTDDQRTGSVTIVTQMMAAAASDREMGQAVLAGFQGWIDLVEEALTRSLEGSPLQDLIPRREAAYAIAAVFLGIELMERLDPSQSEADPVFDAMASLATIFEGALGRA
ncbi:MAG TPA: TetR family transcriptional regulator [Acidimicrobiia bacterium]|jgi:AcrR family transcriptional regulator